MTPAEKLRHAATLIEEAAAALQLENKMCASCARPYFVNWPAKQARDTLLAMPERLHRVASSGAFLSGVQPKPPPRG